MKYIILFIAITCSLSTFAGKTYQLQYTFMGRVTEEPIEDLQIKLIADKKVIATGATDVDGKVVFENVKHKSVSIEITDPSGKYDIYGHYYVNNKSKKDIEREVYLRWSRKLEAEMFNKRDKDHAKNDEYVIEFYSGEKPEGECALEEISETEFPGGPAAMQRFIASTVSYPQKSIEYNEQGRVYLSFIVERSGRITNIKVERGVSAELDREAKMLIYYMPDWVPSMCNGEPVRSRVRLPINFTLN